MFGWLFKKKKVKDTEKIVRRDLKDLKRDDPKPIEEEPVQESEKEVAKEVEKAPTKKRKATNHISKHPQGGWQIKKSGAQRALKRFKTQKEAIEFAKQFEEKTDIAFVIHKTDGTTRKKTY